MLHWACERGSWRRGCRSTGEVEVCHGGRSISGTGRPWNSKAQKKQGQTSSRQQSQEGDCEWYLGIYFPFLIAVLVKVSKSILHNCFCTDFSICLNGKQAPGCKVAHPLINARAELRAGVNLLLIPPPKIPQLPGAGDCSETLQAKASAGYAAHNYPGKAP